MTALRLVIHKDSEKKTIEFPTYISQFFVFFVRSHQLSLRLVLYC